MVQSVASSSIILAIFCTFVGFATSVVGRVVGRIVGGRIAHLIAIRIIGRKLLSLSTIFICWGRTIFGSAPIVFVRLNAVVRMIEVRIPVGITVISVLANLFRFAVWLINRRGAPWRTIKRVRS